MKKDVKAGMIIVLVGVTFALFNPIFGFFAFAVAGPIFLYGIFLIANAKRKKEADRLSADKGNYCYGKVLSITDYGREERIPNSVGGLKYVSVLIYDEEKDKFLIVSDVMDYAKINFIVGEYIAVQFYVNDFNYINNLHTKKALPQDVREKFNKLFGSFMTELNESLDTRKDDNIDTSGWTLTEEAYPEDIALTGKRELTMEEEDALIENIIYSVESVSALKQFDTQKAQRLTNGITIGIVLFVTLLIATFILIVSLL